MATDLLVVIGSVSAKQYQQTRLALHLQGFKPRIKHMSTETALAVQERALDIGTADTYQDDVDPDPDGYFLDNGHDDLDTDDVEHEINESSDDAFVAALRELVGIEAEDIVGLLFSEEAYNRLTPHGAIENQVWGIASSNVPLPRLQHVAVVHVEGESFWHEPI